MVWASLPVSRLAVIVLRLFRQYFCRLESLISIIFIWVLWIYVRWLTERYRPLFGGKHLDYTVLHDMQDSTGFIDIGLNSLRKIEDGLHSEVWRFSRGTVGYYAIRGLRPTMEDRMRILEDPENSGYNMYGIYDGHGGKFVSDFIEKFFMTSVFDRIKAQVVTPSAKFNLSKVLSEEVLSIDSRILSTAGTASELTGSTLLAAFVHKHYLTLAHVGDSRAVMCLRNGDAKQITVDHKPETESEKRRIESAGGWVGWNGVWRVAGILATSRALGDTYLKKLGYITAVPDVVTVDLSVEKPRFVILASDGLWDVMRNQEAVDLVKKNLRKRHNNFGAKNLVELAAKRHSADNVSVMVINLELEE